MKKRLFKLVTFSFVLCLCVSFFSACSTTRLSKNESNYARAREYLEKGQNDEAIELLDEALRQDKDWRYFFYRAMAYQFKGQMVSALGDFNEAAEREDSYPLIFANRGNVHVALGHYEKAFADYERAATLFDKKDRLQIIGGVIIQKRDVEGDLLDKTVTHDVIEEDTGKATVLFNMGLVNELQKDLKEALLYYSKAIAVDENYVMPYYRRGMLYMRRGLFEKALGDFDKAIELKPDYAALYCVRGEVYRLQEEYLKALADFDSALNLNPQFGRAYFCRSLTLKKLGKDIESKQDFMRSKTLGFEPKDHKFFIS